MPTIVGVVGGGTRQLFFTRVVGPCLRRVVTRLRHWIRSRSLLRWRLRVELGTLWGRVVRYRGRMLLMGVVMHWWVLMGGM